MDNDHIPARAVDPRALVGAAPPARVPFDPAGLLEGRRPPASPVAPGAAVVVVAEFDPATFLGERALRGAFNLSTVKPLVTTIGGVEMVTVPASAYSDALRRIAEQELPRETVEQAGPVLDAAGMFDLLMRIDAGEPFMPADVARATGLDAEAFAERKAAWKAAQPQPWKGEMGTDGIIRGTTPEGHSFRMEPLPDPDDADPTPAIVTEPTPSEAHGAALDDGRETEAHGAALAAAKPGKHPRKAGTTREVP